MPELPEVEAVRRTLEAAVVGRRVLAVTLRRRDVVVGPGDPPGGWSRQPGRNRPTPSTARPPRRIDKPALLLGATVRQALRKGKTLALVADAPDGERRCLVIRLGMTGQLLYRPRRTTLPKRDHLHVEWRLGPRQHPPIGQPAYIPPDAGGRLVFRDPRRFGGLWTVASEHELHTDHFDPLGPDALTISAHDLAPRLARTSRPIKAALLDQHVLAGVGNIYADEALFAARVHPARRSDDLSAHAVERLATEIRAVLATAVAAGGTTIRDYLDSHGRPGRFTAHAVYGRAGQPCLRCQRTLDKALIAQRTTVFCASCQGTAYG